MERDVLRKVQLTQLEIAREIRRVCEENDIPCLNLFHDFGFSWQEHTSDGCHPNEAGHILIAKAITEKLRALKLSF